MSDLPGLQRDVPLAPLTTLEVGGASKFYVEATDEHAVIEALAWASERQLPVAIMGGGSNMLVADDGYQGLLIRQRTTTIRIVRQTDVAEVYVAAGVRWDDFVAWAVERNFAGVECLSGIPGDVGAAPIQNIGAYGQEVAEVIACVRAVDMKTRSEVRFSSDECDFAYRESRFKSTEPGRYVITGVDFRLPVGAAATVRYPELERALESSPLPPSLALVRQTVIALRRRKSMVLDPNDENRRSAGSFFVNPVVDQTLAAAVIERAGKVVPGQAVPNYPAPNGMVKLSAAWLIERSGMPKGTVRGQVGLSSKHCLALINRGGATARQLLGFALEVKDAVRETFGVSLVPEPRPLGFLASEIADLYGMEGGRRDAETDLR